MCTYTITTLKKCLRNVPIAIIKIIRFFSSVSPENIKT